MRSPTRAFPWLYWSITCYWLAVLFAGAVWLVDHNDWDGVIAEVIVPQKVPAPAWDGPPENGQLGFTAEQNARSKLWEKEWAERSRMARKVSKTLVFSTALLVLLGFVLGSVAWLKMKKHMFTFGAAACGTVAVNLFSIMASVFLLLVGVNHVFQEGGMELKHVASLIGGLVACYLAGAWFWRVFTILRAPKEEQTETPLPKSWRWSFKTALILPALIFLGIGLWLDVQRVDQEMVQFELEEKWRRSKLEGSGSQLQKPTF